jgi:hypothetical protein
MANLFAAIRPSFVCNGSPATVWDQTSPPTVGANNAGEFIRRYSPVVCVQRIVGPV